MLFCNRLCLGHRGVMWTNKCQQHPICSSSNPATPQNAGYSLYIENYCCNPALCDTLAATNTMVVGTVCANRIGLPKDLMSITLQRDQMDIRCHNQCWPWNGRINERSKSSPPNTFQKWWLTEHAQLKHSNLLQSLSTLKMWMMQIDPTSSLPTPHFTGKLSNGGRSLPSTSWHRAWCRPILYTEETGWPDNNATQLVRHASLHKDC